VPDRWYSGYRDGKDHLRWQVEDDRVTALTIVDAMLKDGRAYHNNIFFLFIIKDGTIHHVTEAVDSHYSRKFWLGK
jgi:ketosteroid isomerase-like protein